MHFKNCVIHVFVLITLRFLKYCYIGALKFLNQEPTNTPPKRLNFYSLIIIDAQEDLLKGNF